MIALATHLPEDIDCNCNNRRLVAEQGGAVPALPFVVIDYDTQQFPFAYLLSRDVFKVAQLNNLHNYVKAHRQHLGVKLDQLSVKDNLLFREMMQSLADNSPFFQLYRYFMTKVITPLVGQSLSYSAHPKMRVHFPGTTSVSSFHHDIIVTKRIDQVNLWMPMVDLSETATLWLESDYGKEDYQPIALKYGQALIFDGGFLGHGSKFNDTDTTRISFDLRFSLKGAKTRSDGVNLMDLIVNNSKIG
ncbi:hypothetical protein [Pseudoalteromonas mariniglutinosa]|uniref:hypothetical protein n=1 Tax=Pseudoalteromonas mariniglutinosa TaxID=206042 RepID=UPI00384C05EA